MSKNKGFTLIELLVVIAIIGILSSVVLASLNSARTKARFASVQATLSSIAPVAVVCLDDDDALTAPDPLTGADGDLICATGSDWPALPNGWLYEGITSDPTADTYTIEAEGATDNRAVQCTNTGGCVEIAED